MIMPTVKTRIFALGCLFELASAPVVQTVAQNGQYIYDVQDGEADIFGQLRYEKNVNGTGLVKLNTANPNGYKWVSDYGYQAGVTPITTAGTYVGSEYYAYETTLYANTLMPRAISVVDVNTGEYTAKREIENSTTEAPLILDELTYDPKTNRIFGLHYDTSANKSYIYEIDRKTLDIALVATIIWATPTCVSATSVRRWSSTRRRTACGGWRRRRTATLISWSLTRRRAHR